jgi:hypothetical protein
VVNLRSQQFWPAFTPKLVTAWREGQIRKYWRQDALAGLTVAIVALPLAMALGIASGATPNQGLVTAVIAGFVISLLGGSRVQIGGPTGAFVVIVAGVIATQGYAGLVLAISIRAARARSKPLFAKPRVREQSFFCAIFANSRACSWQKCTPRS